MTPAHGRDGRQDNRQIDRRATDWPAECHVGQTLLFGRVRDLHAEGAFFQPVLGSPQRPEPGEEVLLRLVYRAVGDVQVKAKVCWYGASSQHRCMGVGLQFVDTPGPITGPP